MKFKTKEQLLSVAKANGFKGKSFEDITEWMSETKTSFSDDDGIVDNDRLEALFASKAVVITVAGAATAADTTVSDDSESDIDDAETLEGDPEDEDEEETQKSHNPNRPKKQTVMQKRRETLEAYKKSGMGAHRNVGGYGRIGDKVSVEKKAYDNAVKNQRPMRGSKGALPVYECADQAEWAGAALRLHTMGAHPYAQKAADTEICTKAGSTFNPATGGVLVAGEYLPQLVELFDEYGVARKMVGVTNMREGQQVVPRMDSDVTVYDVGENDAITASDVGLSDIVLTATKSAALSRQPTELLEDAAISIGDIVSRSSARAVAKWEDEAYFLGQHNRTGIADLLGTVGTDQFDSNSSGWSGITISDVQSAIGLLPGWAYAEGIALTCSSAFYSTVLDTFGMSAGGNTGANLKAGFPGMTMWGQYPVFINESMPSSYVDGQEVMYIGAFGAASKFGVVSGSERFTTSDQRYFDQDQVAFRYTQRWAINCHNIGGAGSGVVALLA